MYNLFATLILLSMFYCKEKNNEPSTVSSIQTESQLVNQILVNDVDSLGSISNVEDSKAESNINSIQTVKQKLKIEVIADSVYKEKLSIGVDTSIHKSRTCEDILREFMSIAEEVLREKDVNIFTAKGWNKNDPIFESCLRSNEAFKKVYYEYNKKIKTVLK